MFKKIFTLSLSLLILPLTPLLAMEDISQSMQNQNSAIIECPTCYEEQNGLKQTSDQCNHTACDHCLLQIIKNSVRENDRSLLRCPYTSCRGIVSETNILRLIGNNQGLLSALGRMRPKEPIYKTCPFCFSPVLISTTKCSKLRCSCGHMFCRQCLGVWDQQHDGKFCPNEKMNLIEKKKQEFGSFHNQNVKTFRDLGDYND